MFERFCYDNIDRLTKAALAVGSDPGAACTGGTVKTVSYDALGDITAKSDVGTYAYPAAGAAQPHAVSSITGTVNGVVNPTFGYDANGNMTTQAGRTVVYSSFNTVRSIVQGTTTIGLSYDDSHARVVQTAPAGTTSYLNDPVSGAMSEKLVSGSTTTWHDYLQIDGQIAAERFCTGAAPCTTGATMRYFVRDHLGSVAAVTNDTGTVVERDAYDAWGRRRNINGSDDPACSLTSQTTRGYTGQEMMDAVCQVNANARVYDATLGRFTSVDPLLDPYDGQDLNGYGYVGNNPLSMTDPSGMNACPPEDSAKDDPTVETVHVCDDREQPTLTAPTDIPTIGVGYLTPQPAVLPFPVTIKPTTPKPKPTTPPAKPDDTNKDQNNQPCPVSPAASLATSLFAGASTGPLPYYAKTAFAFFRGANISTILEAGVAEEIEGGAALLGGPVTISVLIVAGGVYAYDRYSGGAVTNYVRDHLGLGSDCVKQ